MIGSGHGDLNETVFFSHSSLRSPSDTETNAPHIVLVALHHQIHGVWPHQYYLYQWTSLIRWLIGAVWSVLVDKPWSPQIKVGKPKKSIENWQVRNRNWKSTKQNSKIFQYERYEIIPYPRSKNRTEFRTNNSSRFTISSTSYCQ